MMSPEEIKIDLEKMLQKMEGYGYSPSGIIAGNEAFQLIASSEEMRLACLPTALLKFKIYAEPMIGPWQIRINCAPLTTDSQTPA